MKELNKAIYDKLSAGTALTTLLPGTTSIYHLQAPDFAVLPYVVYSVQAGGDENITPSRMKNMVVYVRAYSAVSALAAGSIDTQIDALLHCGSITMSGWTNFWLHRETDVENIDNLPSGEKVWMEGGFYRTRIEQS
jgi:hypothetical protein